MFSRSLVAVSFVGITLVTVTVSAQEIKVKGRFHTDSVKIGQTVSFSLTARYPSDVNVLFPDSSYSFAPFEVRDKKYFPTQTRNHISYDSAVYFLTTFELDSIQKLQLPVFVPHPGDCTVVYSNTSSIILKQLVKTIPDSLTIEKLPLKTNTDYLKVNWLLNYPLLIGLGLVLAAGAVIVWVIFGRRIRRYFALRRLTKNHLAFILQFSRSVDQLQNEFSSVAAESVFVIWKKYMENLVSRPYTKYTSKEILQMEHDEMLGPALRAINKIIYAGVNPSSNEPFTQLRSYTEQQFVKKIEELKHA